MDQTGTSYSSKLEAHGEFCSLQRTLRGKLFRAWKRYSCTVPLRHKIDQETEAGTVPTIFSTKRPATINFSVHNVYLQITTCTCSLQFRCAMNCKASSLSHVNTYYTSPSFISLCLKAFHCP